jgi:hypothetical protein
MDDRECNTPLPPATPETAELPEERTRRICCRPEPGKSPSYGLSGSLTLVDRIIESLVPSQYQLNARTPNAVKVLFQITLRVFRLSQAGGKTDFS